MVINIIIYSIFSCNYQTDIDTHEIIYLREFEAHKNIISSIDSLIKIEPLNGLDSNENYFFESLNGSFLDPNPNKELMLNEFLFSKFLSTSDFKKENSMIGYFKVNQNVIFLKINTYENLFFVPTGNQKPFNFLCLDKLPSYKEAIDYIEKSDQTKITYHLIFEKDNLISAINIFDRK